MGSRENARQPSCVSMPEADLIIRPAQAGEGSILTALCIRSKAHWGYDSVFMAAAARLLRIGEAEIAAGSVLVASAAAQPCAVAAIVPLRRPHWCELSHLFVAPESLGRGIGRALFDAAIALAADRGAHHVSILSDPNAAAFYQKLGARRCGEAPSGVVPNRMLPLFEFPVARRSAAD
ncbi:GNAT family N-acetyltransferase [Dongia sp.]|uniref:GNAT family N-acetyltransferase n=1 Tax=Dongia sp. TaxID=1977262 RepID=UPI003752BA5F